MNLGRIAANNKTGATIAANFAFEKNEEIRNEKVISDKQNVKK